MFVTSEVRKFSLKTLIASSALALVTAAPAKAAVIPLYSQSFDAALGAEWTGSTSIVAVPGGYAAIGFSGSMLRNTTVPPVSTVLTLSGLPTHDAVDINFLLAIIDSWDGIGGTPGPDTFVVRVNGVERFNQVFATASGSDGPGVPPNLGPVVDRGFTPSFADRGFNMGNVSSLNFAHTSSTLVIEFFTLVPGWQGGDDESWGLDALSIDLITADQGPTPVPEPATLSLLGVGLLGAAYRRRNRKS